MVLNVLGIETLLNPEQFLNQQAFSLFGKVPEAVVEIDEGIVTDVSPSHPEKA